MRLTLLACLAAAALAGCGPARPMTSSEFLGFCYQSRGNLFATNSNSIAECNDYATVTQMAHASLRECLAACGAVQGDQYARCKGTGCVFVSDDALGWCEKYCRSNYRE